MSELMLQYNRDDERNLSGSLAVLVQADGFSGRCEVYVYEPWLVDLARRLRTYPLPTDGVGDELMIGELAGFKIHVVPADTLGRPRVQVRVHELVMTLPQQAQVNLMTDYGTIERFSTELVAAANAGFGEARLAN
jgi:hypothetical protein